MTSPINTSALLQADGVGTSHTFNAGFTFGAGNSAIFSMSHYADNSAPASAVTIGGSAATLVSRVQDGANKADIWFVASMTGGNANVAVTNSAGSNYMSGAVTEWASGTLSVDSGTANSATGSSAAPSVSTLATTSTASSIIVAVVTAATNVANNNLTGPTGYTATFTEQSSADHEAGRGAWKEELTSGVKTATFGMTSGAWIAAIAAFVAAGGSAPASANRLALLGVG